MCLVHVLRFSMTLRARTSLQVPGSTRRVPVECRPSTPLGVGLGAADPCSVRFELFALQVCGHHLVADWWDPGLRVSSVGYHKAVGCTPVGMVPPCAPALLWDGGIVVTAVLFLCLLLLLILFLSYFVFFFLFFFLFLLLLGLLTTVGGD